MAWNGGRKPCKVRGTHCSLDQHHPMYTISKRLNWYLTLCNWTSSCFRLMLSSDAHSTPAEMQVARAPALLPATVGRV